MGLFRFLKRKLNITKLENSLNLLQDTILKSNDNNIKAMGGVNEILNKF